MVAERVLLAEANPDDLERATFHLTRVGYVVDRVSAGRDVLASVHAAVPDIVLLSTEMPGASGWDLCKCLRRDPTTRRVPIIMLSDRSRETDIVTGLELGADDYLTKPFNPRILVARVQAVLRGRHQPSRTRAVRVGEVEVRAGRHEVRVRGEHVDLTPSEYRLLALFARQPGKVWTRRQIINSIRGRQHPATDRSVDVLVAGLRKKLGDAADYIETVRGVGYRFQIA
jgi:two-component system phosphate regulon response regulator PhoB